MPIDLYLMNLSPPCRAVLMGIKHLKLDVNVKTVNLMAGEHLKPEFLKLNPAHTVPTLVDNGFSLWESRAILQYLFSKYAHNSPLYPTDLQKRATIDKLLNFDLSLNSSIFGAVTGKIFRGIEPTEQSITTFKNNLKLLETLIGDNKYVTGNELTIADLSVLATLSSLLVNDFKDLDEVPKVKAYNERLQRELPYYAEVHTGVAETLKQFIASKKIMAIELYMMPMSPPSRAVHMLLKHLNIAFKIKNIDLRNGQQFDADYAKINPVKKVPAIVDNGFNVWESRAIMQYLCNKYAPNSSLYPIDIHKRAIVDRLLYFDTFYYQSLREALILKVVRNVDPTPFQLTNYKNTIKQMDQLIGDNKYLAGNELTIADISALATSTVFCINDFEDLNDNVSHLKSWYNRLSHELPYFAEVNEPGIALFKKFNTSDESLTGSSLSLTDSYKECVYVFQMSISRVLTFR
ncbi:uncharacterized protein LOC128958178 [Oppia nitens]|uniref:uncharacterized protein LOC128958178 n=1 Tax=Oppia nitens TaxID=1686743 RepID=UPI0023DA3CAF|nr:uncharacterized protein LOC128958178 [Oppia nitens]